MRPLPNEPLGSQRNERESRSPRAADSPVIPTNSSIRGMRSEGSLFACHVAYHISRIDIADCSTDSWVEISSLPSSSSLSSTSNDIITTGLQIQPRDRRMSRQLQASAHLASSQPRSTSATGSSQDEYEESESDSDRALSSSNEDISQDDNADDDDTSTALGIGSMGRVFTPQPNAFSHPPSSQGQLVTDSYFPAGPASASDRPSIDRTITQRSYQRQSQPKPRVTASSYQPDHDAALRASLTTLLTCAAAVRPKGTADSRATATRPSAHPTSLRLVSESELESPSPPRQTTSLKQTKRKSRESSKERHAKKVRAAKGAVASDELISPTLASWMISAGVVLVFSAISFSAGYAWGHEVGRMESELGVAGGNCSREALRGSGTGLRRLRWTSATSSVRA